MTTSGCNLPTATANSIRCQVFQPTRRPLDSKGEVIKTSWGTAQVNGKLGQSHADVLDAILFCAEKNKIVRNKNGMDYLLVIVDPYQIRKTATQPSGSTLKSIMEDLMRAIVTLHIPARKIKITGHIIDQVVDSKLFKINPMGGDRPMWQITFAPAWTKLLQEDLPLYYDPSKISELGSGITQAIARHVLTHDLSPRGGWKLSELIKTVGASGRERDKRAALFNDAEKLKKMGIELNGDRIFRKPATKSTDCATISMIPATISMEARP